MEIHVTQNKIPIGGNGIFLPQIIDDKTDNNTYINKLNRENNNSFGAFIFRKNLKIIKYNIKKGIP
jgi:hypothetical protein